MNFVKVFWLAAITVIFVGACSSHSYSNIDKPTLLTVGEGFTNPLGYYESVPRFSWKAPLDNKRSTQQLAYQIQVASTFENLMNKPDKWDSGKVQSSAMSWVNYEGKPITSREKVFWRVRFWDENNIASQWSDVAHIELGLLKNSDWKASWIGAKETQATESPSQSTLATPQYFRKPFSLDKKVSKARLYVTAKGVFKVF